MNFIFDIGNVLIDFKPEQFLHDILKNPQDEAKINEVIFKSDEWLLLDKGTITHEQACSVFCKREPEYEALIIKIMDKIPDMLTPMEQSIQLLYKIKELGHKLYYLSNYHTKLSAFIKNKYSFFELFDGGVFSCEVHVLKPYPEIYHHILDKYNLNPKESVFIDDTKENIITAEELGIEGILFSNAHQIIEYLNRDLER